MLPDDSPTGEKRILGLSHDHERIIMIGGAVAGILGLVLLLRARSAAAGAASDTSGDATDATPQDNFQTELMALLSANGSVDQAMYGQILADLSPGTNGGSPGVDTGGAVLTPTFNNIPVRSPGQTSVTPPAQQPHPIIGNPSGPLRPSITGSSIAVASGDPTPAVQSSDVPAATQMAAPEFPSQSTIPAISPVLQPTFSAPQVVRGIINDGPITLHNVTLGGHASIV